MEFDESKFSEYVNEKYGFVIDYFIIENISYDVIKFMTQYANKCEVANFTDTTVDKSLNDADYCPKYDRDQDKKMRVEALEDVINNTSMTKIISDHEFADFIKTHKEGNARAVQEINELSGITIGEFKENAKMYTDKLYPEVYTYIRRILSKNMMMDLN